MHLCFFHYITPFSNKHPYALYISQVAIMHTNAHCIIHLPQTKHKTLQISTLLVYVAVQEDLSTKLVRQICHSFDSSFKRLPQLSTFLSQDHDFFRCKQGFSDVFDIRVLREAELKHGRFAMLAVLGFLVQEKYTLPFFPHIAPVDAHDYFVQQGGGSQIIFWISFVEIFGVVALFETLQVSSPSIPFLLRVCVCVCAL